MRQDVTPLRFRQILPPSRPLAVVMWCFEERSDGVRHRVEQGMWAKVGVLTGTASERFWCRVIQVTSDGTRLLAIVDNNPVQAPLKSGDQIVLQHRHVLEMANLTDMLSFKHVASQKGTQGRGIAARSTRVGASAPKH
jgi:hypothetical protein